MQTSIVVFDEKQPSVEQRWLSDRDEVVRELEKKGIRLERWDASVDLAPEASDEAVIEAYADDIDRLRAEGYETVDVLRVVPVPGDPDWPTKAKGAREKYLDEHIHEDDEVRFFVEGSGIFYIRIDGVVMATYCVAGDLLSVPAGTTHWFDMGTDPLLAVIRLFRIAEGWVAQFTGSPISRDFPTFDQIVHDRA